MPAAALPPWLQNASGTDRRGTGCPPDSCEGGDRDFIYCSPSGTDGSGRKLVLTHANFENLRNIRIFLLVHPLNLPRKRD